MLVVALAAWIALIPVEAAAAGGEVGPMALQATLTTLVVGGLEGVAIGLLPMRFLPGEAVMAWSRRAWAVLFGIGVFAFLHVLINPSSGYLADTERAPLLTIVVLLVAFGAASAGLWAWFRFRPTRPQQVVAVP
jgi:Kef-type K+ transport system membrane component KefB